MERNTWTKASIVYNSLTQVNFSVRCHAKMSALSRQRYLRANRKEQYVRNGRNPNTAPFAMNVDACGYGLWNR